MSKTPEEIEAELEKLREQNATLLDEKKKAKKAAEDAERARQEVLGEKEKLEEEAARKAGDFTKIESALKERHQKELDAAKAQIKALEEARDRLVIDQAISAQIDAIGVAPHFKTAVQAMIKAGNKAGVEIVDGNFVGKIGDKSISDFFKTWAATEEAKHFIAAKSSGGGADPGKGGAGGGGPNPWAKETKNLTRQGQIEKSDPALAERLRREAGVG